MYRFIPPPLVILPPQFKCGCLRASLLAVLRVVYAIVRLSSGKTPGQDHGFVRSSMWISSAAGISKVFCTSEVASATRTSVRMQGILQLGTNLSRAPDFTTIYARRWDIEASGTFHQHKRSNEQAEMVLFAGHMYIHSKGIKQTHVQGNERDARSPPVMNVWSLDFSQLKPVTESSECLFLSKSTSVNMDFVFP